MFEKKRRRFLVSPSGFDDIGAVLDAMGEGFAHDEIDWDDLKNPESLAGCEVLFINCSGEAGDEDYAQEIAPTIKTFVESGGTLYCSCWAIAVLEAMFPKKFRHGGGFSGSVNAQVIEPGLKEFLGKERISITLCGWWPTRTERRFDGQIFLTGGLDGNDLEEDEESGSVEGGGDYPLLFSFRAGRGHVIYTAFHNEEQTSEDEKKLLRYLVLRPVLARAAGAVAEIAKAASCVPGKEILSTVDRGKRSAAFVYQASGSEGLMYVLAWTGSGQMRMLITNPAGKVCGDVRGVSPLRYETNASPGQWSCTIEASSVAHDNFPYVFTLATRRGATTKAAPSPAAVATSATPVVPAKNILWPCYVLIDCSSAASDVAPAVGGGLSSFLRGIKHLPAGSVTPAISLVECRNAAPTVSAPQRVDQLKPISLACHGVLALGPALAEMGRLLAQPLTPSTGKAFVVVVVASELQGGFQNEAAGLKQIAGQGRANVVAIGLGSVVSDATLCSIATIPLRIRDASQQNCVEGFEWLVQVASAMIGALSQKSGSALNLPQLPKGMLWLR